MDLGNLFLLLSTAGKASAFTSYQPINNKKKSNESPSFPRSNAGIQERPKTLDARFRGHNVQ